MKSVARAIADLRDVIIAVFKEPELEALVALVGHNMANEIPTTLAYRLRALQLLSDAWQQRWLEPLLDELEKAQAAASDLLKAIAELRAATGRTRDGWYSEPEASWQAFFVGEQTLLGGLADRDALRRHVEDMAEGVPPLRLLLLRGPENVGKSFSQHLFRRVAARNGDPMAYIDLAYWDDESSEDGGAPRGATFTDVADEIASQLKLGSRPTKGDHTTIAKQAKHLASSLVNSFPTPLARVWIFIDHLDTSAAEGSVTRLIEALAELSLRGDNGLRLITAGRSVTKEIAFGKHSQRSLGDDVPLVHDTHIESFFLNLSEHVSGMSVPLEVAQQAREKVRQGAGGDAYKLSGQLWSVARQLFKPNGGP